MTDRVGVSPTHILLIISSCIVHFLVQYYIDGWEMWMKSLYNVSFMLVLSVLCYILFVHKSRKVDEVYSSDSPSNSIVENQESFYQQQQQQQQQYQHQRHESFGHFNKHPSHASPNIGESSLYKNLSFNSTRGRKYCSPKRTDMQKLRQKAFRNTPPLPPSPLSSKFDACNYYSDVNTNSNIRSYSMSPRQSRKPELRKMSSAPVYSSTQPEMNVGNQHIPTPDREMNISRFSDLSTISARSTQNQSLPSQDIFNLSESIGQIPINASQDRSTVYNSSQSQKSQKFQSQPSQEKSRRSYRRSIHERTETKLLTQSSQAREHMVLTQQSQQKRLNQQGRTGKSTQDTGSQMSIDSRPNSQPNHNCPTGNFSEQTRNQKQENRLNNSMMSLDSGPSSQMSIDYDY